MLCSLRTAYSSIYQEECVGAPFGTREFLSRRSADLMCSGLVRMSFPPQGSRVQLLKAWSFRAGGEMLLGGDWIFKKRGLRGYDYITGDTLLGKD